MGRPKKFTDPVTISTVVERKQKTDIEKMHPNLSEWVREKIQQELNARTILEQTELQMAEVKKKKEEATISVQAAEKEESELAMRLNIIKNPGPTLQKARDEAITRSIQVIIKAPNATKAVELATNHARMLKDKGFAITAEELLTMADNIKNPMYR